MGVFNENLKHYRKNKGISGRELSQLLKISYSTYMNYENRKNQPPYEILCKIADILEVTTDNLLGRNGVISHSNVQEAEKETNTAKKIDFDCMDFNSRLKHFRTLSGISGKEFAEKLGVSYGSYMNYENKKNQPSLQLVCKMANLLNLSTDKLLGHDVDKYNKWISELKNYEDIQITESCNDNQIEVHFFLKNNDYKIDLCKDEFIAIMENCENEISNDETFIGRISALAKTKILSKYISNTLCGSPANMERLAELVQMHLKQLTGKEYSDTCVYDYIVENLERCITSNIERLETELDTLCKESKAESGTCNGVHQLEPAGQPPQ